MILTTATTTQLHPFPFLNYSDNPHSISVIYGLPNTKSNFATKHQQNCSPLPMGVLTLPHETQYMRACP